MRVTSAKRNDAGRKGVGAEIPEIQAKLPFLALLVQAFATDRADTFGRMRFCGTRSIRQLGLFGSLICALAPGLLAQVPVVPEASDTMTDAPSRCCLRATGTALVVGTGVALVVLDQAWYAQYDRSAFHFFDDGAEWMQMDKTGHFFSAYTLGSWSHGALKHCGVKPGPARWIGGTTGLLLLTGVEILDGTSAAWGFSNWDMAANAGGAALFIAQDAGWGEQRIRPKLSAHFTDYAAQRPDLLGVGYAERVLKDYNGLTLWISGNLSSLSGSERFPPWLSVAVGYGAEGMTTAMEPQFGEGEFGQPWVRQFYLSPDLDLTKLKVRSKALRTLLFLLNSIKVPAPTLEVRSDGHVVGHWLYF
jgi:Predicted periplasmic lipoprotein (DUF2279)